MSGFLGETSSLVGRAGAAFYFVPETLARGRELGLDGFRFYFLGRGGVLGDVDAAVVGSAFGYFEPGLLAHMWDTARERSSLSPRQTAAAYLGCAHRLGRERLGRVERLGEFADGAAAVVAAMEPAGLALFAGVRAQPLPDDPPARAAQLVVALREMRGSAHLLAVRAAGLPPVVAHSLRRPDDVALFGWKEADRPAVGDEERRRLAAADALTDELVLPAYSAVEPGGRDGFLATLREVSSALAATETPPVSR